MMQTYCEMSELKIDKISKAQKDKVCCFLVIKQDAIDNKKSENGRRIIVD